MPGTNEQKFATLRALYAYMWAHPGKKLLFMGGEFGQWREWTETESLDWHLLDKPLHSGLQQLVRNLNRKYFERDALWFADGEAAGFEWIDVDNAAENIVAFIRRSPQSEKELICVGNFSAVPRQAYRLGLPREGHYKILVNTDAEEYGGRNGSSGRDLESEPVASHGRAHSVQIDLPPLTTVWLEILLERYDKLLTRTRKPFSLRKFF
ncbi:MAG TPA: alpha amylase C-terminal domain-containing protein, partial [Pyrinomonadaceae bacterium]|nr:alpha amylase C-terminal domain-containing protein [Pyrinomonadaceae bacterium]